MLNLSFMHTTEQVRNSTPEKPLKDVTRRRGDYWFKALKPGMLVQAIVKGQGMKPGEKIEKIRVIEIVSRKQEYLSEMMRRVDYGAEEARREGFPEMTGAQFVEFFCKAMDCQPYQEVTRIEFRYID